MNEPTPAPDRFDDDKALTRPSDPRASTPTGRRAGSRIVLGMVVGPVAGAILGLIVGLILFGVGTPGMWASCLAGGLVGFILGAFWGGLSGLGPVEPENDPLPRMSPEDRDDPPGSGGSSVVG